MRKALLVSALAILTPGIASAQVLSSIAGLFNIMAGLMLVAAFLLFFGGGAMWFTRLGTSPTYRNDAINLMKWAVVVLFVLAILLFLVQFVQQHAAVAAFIVGVVVVGLVLWVIFSVATGPKADKEH